MSLRSHQYRKPPVYVAESEYDRLANLAASGESRGAQVLAEELARATVVSGGELPLSVVRLRSQVEFTDLTTSRTRTVQVVLPEEADIDRNRLSVLSPVGAALIGLPAGESIGLRTEDGRSHVLVVVSVEPAHEPA